MQDLAQAVSGDTCSKGEKSVRLQAQGYRVAGRILVRQTKDGKKRFTVCGRLAEAAGITEVKLKNGLYFCEKASNFDDQFFTYIHVGIMKSQFGFMYTRK